ncbi:hypothetical protein HAX54_044487 [Datura stramonium]|uniref:Uncharacterized protein n=1 Tax=Datura stramonium TaxID=4076 RepID=A0ABS8WEN3_DATST|nr:hypothetical protein [Datura stramonium]
MGISIRPSQPQSCPCGHHTTPVSIWPLIYDDLLFKYIDLELIEHLKVSKGSLKNDKERDMFNQDEAWWKKLGSILPADGIAVKHIKTGEDLLVSRRLRAVFLLMTMADFSDQ